MHVDTCVDEQMLLQVCQLGERLGTHLAAERSLPRMGPQVDLQVAQLAKHLVAGLALVLNLAVLLLERIGQRLVAGAAHLLLAKLQK